MYSISQRTQQEARRLGVSVRPSRKPGKKIDVIRDGEVIASIGARGMGDYHVYRRTMGEEYATNRRRLYRARHRVDQIKPDTPAYWASELLW